MARGEGDSEDAWPEEDPPLLDWCRAVRGSRSRAGAGGETEEAGGMGGEGRHGGEEEVRAAGGDGHTERQDSDSMVMAGQEEDEAAGVGGVITGPDLEPTVQPDPDPEPGLKPAWSCDGEGL